MSSLEQCADALLHQKAIQSSNHEHLETHIRDLERETRAEYFALKRTMASVARRAQDVAEQREGNRRLEEQLSQCRLKQRALAMQVARRKKNAQAIIECLNTCAAIWGQFPDRMAHAVKALQERKQYIVAARELATALTSASTVVACCRHLVSLRGKSTSTLRSHHEALQASTEALKRRHQAAMEQCEQHKTEVGEAEATLKGNVAIIKEAQQNELDLRVEAQLTEEKVTTLQEMVTTCSTAVAAASEEIDRRDSTLLALRRAHSMATLDLEETANRLRLYQAAVEEAEQMRTSAVATITSLLERKTEDGQRLTAEEGSCEQAMTELAAARKAAAAELRGLRHLYRCVTAVLAQRKATMEKRRSLMAGQVATLQVLRARRDTRLAAEERERARVRHEEQALALTAEEALTRRSVVAEEEQLLSDLAGQAIREVSALTAAAFTAAKSALEEQRRADQQKEAKKSCTRTTRKVAPPPPPLPLPHQHQSDQEGAQDQQLHLSSTDNSVSELTDTADAATPRAPPRATRRLTNDFESRHPRRSSGNYQRQLDTSTLAEEFHLSAPSRRTYPSAVPRATMKVKRSAAPRVRATAPPFVTSLHKVAPPTISSFIRGIGVNRGPAGSTVSSCEGKVKPGAMAMSVSSIYGAAESTAAAASGQRRNFLQSKDSSAQHRKTSSTSCAVSSQRFLRRRPRPAAASDGEGDGSVSECTSALRRLPSPSPQPRPPGLVAAASSVGAVQALLPYSRPRLAGAVRPVAVAPVHPRFAVLSDDAGDDLFADAFS